MFLVGMVIQFIILEYLAKAKNQCYFTGCFFTARCFQVVMRLNANIPAICWVLFMIYTFLKKPTCIAWYIFTITTY